MRKFRNKIERRNKIIFGILCMIPLFLLGAIFFALPGAACASTLAMGLPVSMDVNSAAAYADTGIVASPPTGSLPARATIYVPGADQPIYTPQQVRNVNNYPNFDVVTVTINSATGGGAAPTRVYLFNQSWLKDIDDNGSGAASITYAWQDGKAGELVSLALSKARTNLGAINYGFQMRMVDDANVGDPTALANASPYWLFSDILGRDVPCSNFNMTINQSRSDNDTSVQIGVGEFNVSDFSQFSYVQGIGATTLTFYFTPYFKR